MRAAYGKKMRQLFADNIKVIQLIDLGPGVFEATVDANILILKKSVDAEIIAKACKIESSQFNSEIIKDATIDFDTPTNGEPWLILNPIERRIKEKIERIGTPLKEWDINIYRGILTGYNKAFIIDNETKERLIAEDPKSAEILKPILRGRDIKRYHANWRGLWLINTHNGYGNTPPIDINSYLAVKNHLDKYWERISVRQDKGTTPYNLRNCAYYEEFERDKIVYQEIVQDLPAFFYDSKREYYLEATAFLMTGSHLKYMLLFLNSSLSHYLFRNFYSGGGLGNQGIRYKKCYLQKIYIPKINDLASTAVSNLLEHILHPQQGKYNLPNLNKLNQNVNELFYNLFDFTELEIRTIENGINHLFKS